MLRRQRLRLVNNLVTWEQAERLRRFIAAVEEVGGGDEVRAWLEWANAQVQALDPLCSDLSAITNLEVQVEPYFTGRPPGRSLLRTGGAEKFSLRLSLFGFRGGIGMSAQKQLLSPDQLVGGGLHRREFLCTIP